MCRSPWAATAQCCTLLQAVRIGERDCTYALEDWPAAERSCTPWYNAELRGLIQQLPVFEVLPGSSLLAAEAAAAEGFQKLEAEGQR